MNITTIACVVSASIAFACGTLYCPQIEPKHRDAIAMERIEASKRDGTITNLCALLVKTGEHCNALGHRWEPGCGNLGCTVIHYDEQRHCSVCKLTQCKSRTDWK